MLVFLGIADVKPENFSLMLSEAEQEILNDQEDTQNSLLDNLSNKKPFLNSQAINQPVVFLSAILCVSPEKWSIWVNDQVISSLGVFEGIDIKAVSSQEIMFNLDLDNKNQIFYLRPNQSFLLDTRKIVTGDCRTFTHLLSHPEKGNLADPS